MEEKKKAGRPEYGRRIEGKDELGNNRRKSRSVWSTHAENQILKSIMEIIKNDPDYAEITIGEVIERYLKENPEAKLLEGEKSYSYKPFNTSVLINDNRSLIIL